ncbi:MAG: hypothetical protein II436_01125 [Oscillospiraceae bacterium]|nr:hypothetical protein [Oscillospiraceae bacterium]
MLRRLMVVAIFFVPIGAVACWVSWFTKRSRVNDVAQSWMREKRREEARGRLVWAITLTVATILAWIFLYPSYHEMAMAAQAAAEATAG